MREIGLTGDWAKTGEFRAVKTRNVVAVSVRVRNAVKYRQIGRGGRSGWVAELKFVSGHSCSHEENLNHSTIQCIVALSATISIV
jgi:hypothetical protein